MPELHESSDAFVPSASLLTASSSLQSFLDISPDALVIVNRTGLLVLINRRTEALFDYSQAELLGQPLDRLLPQQFREVHATHRVAFFAAPHPRSMGIGLDLVGLRKNGTEFPVDISLTPLLLDGELHVVGAVRDITAQRQLEHERLQYMEHLTLQSTLINLAHDAILVRDPVSRILSWNQGAQTLYGWTEQEALGRVSHSLLKTHFPMSRAVVEAQLEREGHWEGELIHAHRDAHTVVVESRQVLLRDQQGEPKAFLEMNRDITRRRRLEEAQTAAHAEVLAQRTFLQDLLDALPSSVCVVHGYEACLVLINRAATSIWGAQWPVGQSMQMFLQEHHIGISDVQGRTLPPEQWAAIRALHSGETVVQHQETIHQPLGSSLPILVNAVPLASPHWQSLDIRKPQEPGQLDPQREPLALVIHQDVRLLKEAEYFKDEFIGIASHELRQPLAVLKGTVGTLLLQTARGHGPQLAEWQEELLQDLEQATDQLTTLTEDLLDISRLQAGQLHLQRTSTNLVLLVQRLVERFQVTTTRHRLDFHSEQPRLEVMVDPYRIEQVLSNLLSNAIKYSPQGGSVRVRLHAQKDAGSVDIQVQDEGIGIPLHQQAHIFGRFMRAENAQAAGIRGTGLGLYLCRALVDQHAGRLWFESTEGVGSTFVVTLPLDLTAKSGPL